MALLDDIREQFPDLAWLINDPEIGKLLREAVDPNAGFSAQRFESKVRQTKWWRRNSAAQRSWAIKVHTDSATANQERASYMAQLNQQAAQLGVKLNSNELRFITEVGLSQGRAVNDPRNLYALAKIREKPGRQMAGAIKTDTHRVQAMSNGDYFIPISNREAHGLGSKIARGAMTMDDVQALLQERAASRYKHLADRLNAGETMRDIFAGHVATIAEELEISPESINLSRGRWSKVLDQVDPKDGKHRALSLYETRILAREDPRFWRTQHGQAEDAQMATMMAQTFGKRA